MKNLPAHEAAQRFGWDRDELPEPPAGWRFVFPEEDIGEEHIYFTSAGAARVLLHAGDGFVRQVSDREMTLLGAPRRGGASDQEALVLAGWVVRPAEDDDEDGLDPAALQYRVELGFVACIHCGHENPAPEGAVACGWCGHQ